MITINKIIQIIYINTEIIRKNVIFLLPKWVLDFLGKKLEFMYTFILTRHKYKYSVPPKSPDLVNLKIQQFLQ